MKITPIHYIIFQTKQNKKEEKKSKKVLTKTKFDDIMNTEIKREENKNNGKQKND